LRKERKLKMAGVDPKGVDDEDGKERKTKGSAHLRLKRISVLIIVEKRPSAALSSSFVVPAYPKVRLTPWDFGSLASGPF